MKKIILIFLFLFIKPLAAEELQKAYFAGGCFWCVEEYFDKVEGSLKQHQVILVDTLKIQPMNR